jgi:transposase
MGAAFIADAAYDSANIVAAVAARGMVAVIPPNPTRKHPRRYDKRRYRMRYRIEVLFHELKRNRRIATRFEKTARNYLGFIHLACALLWM